MMLLKLTPMFSTISVDNFVKYQFVSLYPIVFKRIK
jgi:hypothetical protein